MARLKAATRNRLPDSAFGLPGPRKYPEEDRAHAADAKSRVSTALNHGRISPAAAARVRAKANRILGEK